MEKLVINGGNKLCGSVSIGGAKNAAVAILPATVLGEGVSVIHNIPNVKDVSLELRMLEEMGAKVRLIDKKTVEIDTTHISSPIVSYELAKNMRASYYFLGSLLARMGTASVSMPGGCNFGVRPIDQHIKGFELMGATVEIENGMINANAEQLIGTHIYFDVVSVGATMNVMLAACRAEGMTILENVAKEPHIVDLANYLNSMGAEIRGAGTDVIKIRGVKEMHGADYTIIPDQIEAGTYMAAVAATGGNAIIENVIPKHLESITAKLRSAGVMVEEGDDWVRVSRVGEINAINVATMPHPGFPTDMQPQIAAMLLFANGTSIITEGVWDNRFKYIDELVRLGAKVVVDGKIAVITGNAPLTAAPVKATDLRGGAALVIAGLCINGRTEIEEIKHIKRGYENIIEKLQGLGADIKIIDVPDDSIQGVIIPKQA